MLAASTSHAIKPMDVLLQVSTAGCFVGVRGVFLGTMVCRVYRWRAELAGLLPLRAGLPHLVFPLHLGGYAFGACQIGVVLVAVIARPEQSASPIAQINGTPTRCGGVAQDRYLFFDDLTAWARRLRVDIAATVDILGTGSRCSPSDQKSNEQRHSGPMDRGAFWPIAHADWLDAVAGMGLI